MAITIFSEYLMTEYIQNKEENINSYVMRLYEQMTYISDLMAEAASQAQWAALTKLTQQYHEIAQHLLSDKFQAVLNDSQLKPRKIALIKKMLNNDAEIRRHTQPWIDQLAQQIGQKTNYQRVQRRYN